MVVFVSPTVGGSAVGAPIGGGGVSLTVFGFMLVVVCRVSNERAANVVQARRTWRGPVSIDTAVPLKVRRVCFLVRKRGRVASQSSWNHGAWRGPGLLTH